MQDLKLVGVHDDGEHLVLSTPDGQKYLLVVDDPLRAAVRLDRARLGQLQIETEGRLRPRDIQSRIRAGQTAEEVAEAAGLPVEHVRRFEGPVLAEREFVVRQAQAVRLRNGGRGASAALGELVAERLTARAVEEEAQSWDAWRGDDGVWIVALTFTAGSRERQARWTYDAQLRHVSPRDDEARWLTEDDVEEPGQHQRRLTPVGGTRREHDTAADAPIRDRVYDVEADGGVRPVEEPRPAVANATVDLLESLRERRGRRQRTSPAGDPELAGGSLLADPMDAALHGGTAARPPQARTELLDELPAAHPPASRPDLAGDVEVLLQTDDDGPDDPDDPDDPDLFGGLSREADTAETPVPELDRHALPVMTDTRDGAPATTIGSAAGPSHDASLHGASAQGSPLVGAPLASSAVGSVDVTTAERPAGRRARRPSVPKWDDIVFGSRRE